ncbi:MAG: hypothetical protein B5M52_03835 [Helicobacteraceae bacterium 4484_230]|nr:MAG: hypothetical protein B5M52_03835 [Helicobacteraceae bacterium 4484_230]
MESKVWVINDPDAEEEKPKPKPVRIYLIVMIVIMIAVGGYFAYEYLLASGNKAVIDKVLDVQSVDIIRAVQGKKSTVAPSKAYTAEDIVLMNEKLLTWSDVDRRVGLMDVDGNVSAKSHPACPDGYETAIVERIYAQETYCYSQKKSFLLQKKVLADNTYTVTDYAFDKNGKTDSVERYLLSGEKISE